MMNKPNTARVVLATVAMILATAGAHLCSVKGVGMTNGFEKGVSIRDGSVATGQGGRIGRRFSGRGIHGGK